MLELALYSWSIKGDWRIPDSASIRVYYLAVNGRDPARENVSPDLGVGSGVEIVTRFVKTFFFLH